MIDVIKTYKKLCDAWEIPFNEEPSLLSYDDSTLFCPAGMQKYKKFFGAKEMEYETVANTQKCLRLNDFDEIGDGIHALSFDMIGLFSFNDWGVGRAIDFFLTYLWYLNIKPDYVTVHPDRGEWAYLYPSDLIVKPSEDCQWSDGQIGGYCTEFFVIKDGKEIEIGNIVNPLGHSIDVGFGKERLEYILGAPQLTDIEQLIKAATDIINSGVLPSANKQGYVLRKILREIYLKGGQFDHKFYHDESDRMEKSKERYEKLKDKYPDKSPEWWHDTHGVII